jgi:hypothetical protein
MKLLLLLVTLKIFTLHCTTPACPVSTISFTFKYEKRPTALRYVSRTTAQQAVGEVVYRLLYRNVKPFQKQNSNQQSSGVT